MTLTAKYSGRCATCEAPIAAGDRIEWEKATRTTRHARCVPGGAEQEAARVETVAASRRPRSWRWQRRSPPAPAAAHPCRRLHNTHKEADRWRP